MSAPREIVKRVAAFRKTHAQEKREEEARRTAPLKAKPANNSHTPSIDEMRSYVQSGHVKWDAPVKQPGLEGSQQHRPRSREPTASRREPSKPAPQRKASKGPAP